MTPAIEEAAKLLRGAAHGIAVTGAGASVESGIPDFRSANGIWEKFPPEHYATIDAFHRDPDRVWGMWHELGAMMAGVTPNPGHHALAELESLGRLCAIITQNIDNLHQSAGSRTVIEYHGNARRMRCMACEAVVPLVLPRESAGAPRCERCDGLMKPDVVMFGEYIPVDAMTASEEHALRCDVVLIVGTSATVYPAAGIPGTAKSRGAAIIECNLEKTDFTRSITDVFIEGPCGETLPALVSALKAG